ncbi:MAG TPA: glycosyltransferase [Polyangiaceae bacterium]|nr:glycosyltransferase [Polyangiaceae bacterium]
MSATGTGSSGRAFLTIVSANYLAAARVLCRSLAEHHPEARRFVLLVDDPRTARLREDEPFETIPASSIGIPEYEDFLAQYTVIEANTAVKPFAMRHLLGRGDVEELVYLDPDILVLSPLARVFEALERASVVLTPHLADPFRDEARPTEREILGAGTYNLGFIAVRNGEATRKMLGWWSEKTTFDCVIAPEQGLFVDQKWMDLVPGYVPGTAILHDRAYNVAYWNLHERTLSARSGRWYVDGEPLAFFHFSGYDPARPSILSKHQTRHHLRAHRDLRALCDLYAELLHANGHEEQRHVPYAHTHLGNGLAISPVLRRLVRNLRKARIPHPSVGDADAFCRFVMTPHLHFSGANVAPFVAEVLAGRPDVLAAYPGARRNARDPNFLGWLQNSAHECESRELVAKFGAHLTEVDAYERVAEVYERRSDVRAAYPDAFRTLDGLERFADWLVHHGGREEGVGPEVVREFVDAGKTGFSAVIDMYLSRPEIQERYPLALLPCGDDFQAWLLATGARQGNLTAAQCGWFRRRVQETSPSVLLALTALRTEWANLRFPLATTVFGWRDFAEWARGQARARGHELSLADSLPVPVPMLSQIETIHATGSWGRQVPDAFRSAIVLRRLVDRMMVALNDRLELDERARLENEVRRYAPARGVNVAGHFHYAAGVGSAAHSLTTVLDAAGIQHHDVTLPVAPTRMRTDALDAKVLPERLWELHRPDFDVAITVANADVTRAARAYLGPRFECHRRRIGYWVWETDRLPGECWEAAEGFDEIWTPSEYSARGIRNTLGDGARISVVPYTVASHAPGDPRPLPIALPEDRTLFGFSFDARSVIERKNPAALVRAFREAFRPDDRVALVLKVSHGETAPETMRELERLADGLPVIWLRDVCLDEFQMKSFLSRLDVYASLHRAEGFGLVLAEAMALGRPVVATGFSGNMEFMDADSARIVAHREVVTDRSHGPYPRGTRWAEPDVAHAAHLFRELHGNAELRKELGRRARARIESTLAPFIVARTVARLLGFAGPGPGPASALGSQEGTRRGVVSERPFEARSGLGLAAQPGE